MSLHQCTATLWLLLTFLGAIASGKNASLTSPPVHNATKTVVPKLTTSFRAPSRSYPATATGAGVTVTPTYPSKSSQGSKRTAPPLVVTTTPHTATRETQEAASVETFVMPSVEGLVKGEIRSSMESGATPAGDVAVRTPALASAVSFVDATSEPSTTSEPYATSTADSLTNVTEQDSAATMATAASTSSTEPEQDDMAYLASLFPDLDLLDDPTPYGSTSTPPSVPTTTPAADAPTIQKPSGYNMSRERYCIAARYCYKDLNERCVMRHMKSVCGCGRAFYRNPETLVCERKLPLLVSLELPEHSYVQEVADKKSLEFKAYESAAQHLIWRLVKSSKLLAGTVIDIEVTGFRPGLMVRSRLVVMSSLVHKLAGNVSAAVHREIQTAIERHNSTGLFLHTGNMRTVAADVAVNPCEDRDSNYCSSYAICTYRKHDYGMSCRCLPGYADVSPDTGHHPGELCFSICEPGHCQNNGTCKSLSFGIECECRDWYIGNRCQFQMKQIIIIVVVVAAVLLTVVGVTFHKYWRKGRLQSCNNQVCRMLIMEPAKRSSAKRHFDTKLSARQPLTDGPHQRTSTCLSPGSASLHSAFSKSLEGALSPVEISVISK
ncbi:uncharacterized protein [Dermacentor albipictus]|uniref:uncharacterized protein n=1 Tax=Dermacentor albipictus TaxID=60249 RepID=UPI0031FD3495